MIELNYKKLNADAKAPTFGTEFSAGADLYSCENNIVTFLPGETKIIHTGIALEIPNGYVGLVYARSGIATKRGLAPANMVGVIDSDYRGEIMVALYNHSSENQQVEINERIAQIVITPYLSVKYTEKNDLSNTERADKGFGSTGKI